MMFDTYAFFEPIVIDHATITGIYSCTGYADMDDALARYRTFNYPILMVEDAPDGVLDIGDSPKLDQNFNIYVICDGKKSRRAAFVESLALGEELLRMLKEYFRALESFSFKMNESSIPLQRIGPLPKSGFGYCFTFSL